MMDSLSLVFTGDIGFDKYMDGKWNDEALLDDEVISFLNSGDHIIANVEGPLSKGEKDLAPNGVLSLMHSMDPKVADFLNRINADIWNLCNNHIMDAGPLGISDTLKKADELNVKTIGAGMNILEASKALILDDAGGIGIFSVGYQRGCKKAREDYPGCLGWDEFDIIQNRINEIKKECRWCIIVAHGGEEFTPLPSPYTRDRYLKYLDMGADIIVCHHPHVPMNYEITSEGKAIFYSLGNFIFDTDYQRSQYYTEKGILLRLDINRDSFSFEAFGLNINRNNEHIEHGDIPAIFTNVDKEEYELLKALSAKAFISASKRQQIYLKPEEYKNADEAKWVDNFFNPKRSGRVPFEALDFQIIYPLAQREKEKDWEKSKLKEVVKYIQDMM